MRRAALRMASLIREGVAPSIAATRAADEYGVSRADVAAECARFRAEAAALERAEQGRMTEPEAKDFARTWLLERQPRFNVRRAVFLAFVEVVTAGYPCATVIASACADHFGDLEPDARFVAEYELRRLFELLPPELDPRTPVAVAIGRDSLWPVVDESTFYRWIGNGS